MIFSLCFTALAVVNLICYVVGLALLPSVVPIRFGAGLSAVNVGSPWVYAAFPAAAAFLAGALFLAGMMKSFRGRAVLSLFLSFCASALIVLGWTFFALSLSFAKGGHAVFPYALVIVAPLSLLLVLSCGGLIIKGKTRGEGGKRRRLHLAAFFAFFAAGALSLFACVLFSLFWEEMAYLSAAVFALLLLLALLFVWLFFKRVRQKYHDKL